jgi:hypothetical protein
MVYSHAKSQFETYSILSYTKIQSVNFFKDLKSLYLDPHFFYHTQKGQYETLSSRGVPLDVVRGPDLIANLAPSRSASPLLRCRQRRPLVPKVLGEVVAVISLTVRLGLGRWGWSSAAVEAAFPGQATTATGLCSPRRLRMMEVGRWSRVLPRPAILMAAWWDLGRRAGRQTGYSLREHEEGDGIRADR